jgi:hypothetical protein
LGLLICHNESSTALTAPAEEARTLGLYRGLLECRENRARSSSLSDAGREVMMRSVLDVGG